jgi:hypothetical protein
MLKAGKKFIQSRIQEKSDPDPDNKGTDLKNKKTKMKKLD